MALRRCQKEKSGHNTSAKCSRACWLCQSMKSLSRDSPDVLISRSTGGQSCTRVSNLPPGHLLSTPEISETQTARAHARLQRISSNINRASTIHMSHQVSCVVSVLQTLSLGELNDSIGRFSWHHGFSNFLGPHNNTNLCRAYYF